jgi:hypothetical protein
VRANGEVDLIGADIRGTLSCSGGEFSNVGRTALILDRAEIHGNLHLRGQFTANGEVRLVGATIDGDLSCSSGRFLHNFNADALAAQGATVNGSVRLRKNKHGAFRARGRIRFDGAHILGDLDCRDGSFVGGLGLSGAKIGGQLICINGQFRNLRRPALDAEQAEIHGKVSLGFDREQVGKDHAAQEPQSDVIAAGEVTFFGASIGSDLVCYAGKLQGSPTTAAALRLERTNIGGAVVLSSGFQAEGNLLIAGATIDKDLNLTGANFTANECKMVYIQNNRIKGDLDFQKVQISPHTEVDLRGTSCDVLRDDLKSWPLGGKLNLDGFVYHSLKDPGPVMSRINIWLRGQLPPNKRLRAVKNRLSAWARGLLEPNRGSIEREFRPQPYRQLAAVLRAQGLDRDAKKVLIAMANDRWKWGKEGSRILQWLSWLFIGNGYRPLRAGLWLIGLWIVGYIAFGIAYSVHVMVPTDRFVISDFVDKGTVPPNYEPFCSATYAIDTSLPIISFGLKDKWHPAVPSEAIDRRTTVGDNASVWTSLCGASAIARGFHQIMGRWLHYTEPDQVAMVATALPWVRWGYIAIGWFLWTMFVAGISGLVGRE